jgi:hypothetical protein
MPENNNIMSVEGQLVGIPVQEYTAGPGIVVDNVNKVISVDRTWQDITSQFTWQNVSDNKVRILYCPALKLLFMQGYVQINVSTTATTICTFPNNLKSSIKLTEIGIPSTLEEKHGVVSTNDGLDSLTFKWITQPSNKYAGVYLMFPVEEV